ncbi:MAG: hypothetical protein KatS3mg020_0900 [Fimbriimonadales bacterium]|nr:MAG: hypothetical protein KatS3mg020_0900 [Fimbriimonadales bacterium]
MVAIDHTRGNQVSLRWLLYDGHGNLVRTMAPDYTLSAFQWRGVWGEVQGVLGTGRGYCANLGHPEDETGLVYMRARYYEPVTGRFISEDPARDGVNWYLYADGNPVNRTDFTGQLVDVLLSFTIGEDTYTIKAQLDIQAKRVISGRIHQLVTRYGNRLQAILRHELGADDSVSAIIHVFDAQGKTIAVYHAVWNPYTMELIHFHLKYGVPIAFF